MPIDKPGQVQAHATRMAFFIAGFGMAAWAPLVPFAKERLGIQEGALGTLLLCLGAGSIIAMPLAGVLTSRVGCRRVLILSVLLTCATLPMLAQVSSILWLGLALFFFGAGIGSLDCAMNIQAIILERASGRIMMSGFHGLFSMGGVVGAAGVSGLLSMGASPWNATLTVVAVIAVLLALSAPYFLAYGGRSSGPAFALARGVVLFIGVLCFILFLTEGAVLDWSAVFLADVRGMSPAHAGLGYAAFAATMTAGRLTGDRFVKRVGLKMGYAGVLLGPASIGFVAHASNLVTAFGAFMSRSVIRFAAALALCPGIPAWSESPCSPDHVDQPKEQAIASAGLLSNLAKSRGSLRSELSRLLGNARDRVAQVKPAGNACSSACRLVTPAHILFDGRNPGRRPVRRESGSGLRPCTGQKRQ